MLLASFSAIIPVFEQENGEAVGESADETASESSARDAVRMRATMTDFTWSPAEGEAQPANVSLIGEWDWNTHTDLTFDSSSSQWSTSLDLDEGLYCYKFVVGEADYRFDPNNSYRGYCGQFENSVMRVANDTAPMLTIGENFRILYWAGSSGAEMQDIEVTISHHFVTTSFDTMWFESDWSLQLMPPQMNSGKHTIRLTATDMDNATSETLLMPFWVGDGSTFVWQDALIYMVMTDRFVNGNSSNDPAPDSTATPAADWKGGDFAGVTQMIESDYFGERGINVLWLSPFNTAANRSGTSGDGGHEVTGYHGYWPVEARGVDARLGTPEELEELVSAAHSKDMRVMFDFVVNHVFEDHPYYTENPEWFSQGCMCGEADCDWTEHRLDCLFRTYMPDVNWRNREASEQFIDDALWWLERFDLDGARIDAVKHVDDLAITNLAIRINERFETVGTDYYLKGETAMGWVGHDLAANQPEYEMINRYIAEDGLDGQADFVLYHAVVDNVFTSGQMDYQHLDYWTARSQDQYVAGATMVPFIGSHDSPRFISRADPGTSDAYNQWVEQGLPGQPATDEPYIAAKQAFTWLLATPGAAMVYQGDEYGEYGGGDPDNRHLLRDAASWSENEAELAEFFAGMGLLRGELTSLRRGTYTSLENGTDSIGWAMQTEDESAIVVMNRGFGDHNFQFDLTSLVGDWGSDHPNHLGEGNLTDGFVKLPGQSVGIFSSGYSVESGGGDGGNNTGNGTGNQTDPNFDSDGDGYVNGCEDYWGTDPLNSSSFPGQGEDCDLWQNGNVTEPEPPWQPTLDFTAVISLGDSTQHDPQGIRGPMIGEHLAERLDVPFTRFAIGGSRTYSMIEDSQHTDAAEQFGNGTVAIIWIGGNDIRDAGMEIAFGDFAVIDQMEENLSVVLATLRGANITVVLANQPDFYLVPAIPAIFPDYTHDDFRNMSIEWRSRIAALAVEYDAMVWDIFEFGDSALDSPENRTVSGVEIAPSPEMCADTCMFIDMLHPSSIGNGMLSNHLFATMNEYYPHGDNGPIPLLTDEELLGLAGVEPGLIISGLLASSITYQSVIISWNTSQPANATIACGPFIAGEMSQDYLVVEGPTLLSTLHSLLVEDLPAETMIECHIQSGNAWSMLHFNTTAFIAEDEPGTGGTDGTGGEGSGDEPIIDAESEESVSNIMLYALVSLVVAGVGMLAYSSWRNRDEDGPKSDS